MISARYSKDQRPYVYYIFRLLRVGSADIHLGPRSLHLCFTVKYSKLYYYLLLIYFRNVNIYKYLTDYYASSDL